MLEDKKCRLEAPLIRDLLGDSFEFDSLADASDSGGSSFEGGAGYHSGKCPN